MRVVSKVLESGWRCQKTGRAITAMTRQNIGVGQTVFLVNRVFVPCKKTRGRFDENGENDKFHFTH